MFKKGDWIIYGSSGVCQVEDIGAPDWAEDSQRQYYKLAPLYDAGTIHIPVDTDVFMRPILTKQEAQELVARIPEICADPCEPCDPRALAEHYREFLQSHACEDLAQLIKIIYEKGQDLARHGKKPGKTDQQYRKRAEDLLNGELAVALGIPVEDVSEYIRRAAEGETVGL